MARYERTSVHSATFEPRDYQFSEGSAPSADRVSLSAEVDRLEKELHHLCGRVQELGARIEPVLSPHGPELPTVNVKTEAGKEALSPLGETLIRYRRMVESACRELEDMLTRIEL